MCWKSSMVSGRGPDIRVDIGLMQTLVSAVRDHAMYLSDQSPSATSGMKRRPAVRPQSMQRPPKRRFVPCWGASRPSSGSWEAAISARCRNRGRRHRDARRPVGATARPSPGVRVGRGRLLHEADFGVVQIADACRTEVRQVAAHRDVARRLEQRQAETDRRRSSCRVRWPAHAPSRGRVRRRSARPSRRSPGC